LSSEIPEITFKIFLTIVLSSLIGIEREIRRKSADLRTYILVGVSSALLVLTSLYLFDIYKHETVIDPTRIIAGIITGIGFLCAGCIIRGGDENVIGITTAATLWIVSGIGIAVGAGLYTAAIIVTFVVFFVLIGVRSFERKIGEKFKNLS
jgi:putative Mg2+ transporter-C (MgtC) family protein